MAQQPFSLVFIEGLIERFMTATEWQELSGADGGPRLSLVMAEQPEQSAGYVRYWVAAEGSPLDRMVHMRLIAGPVETQLLFVFGRAGTTMPHIHAQAVQFPPEGCVYNVDFLPRLDPVDHPEWFERVFTALRRPYRRATAERDNSCAQAPANPMLALYMSPWSIASAQTDRAELDRVTPSIEAYVDHYVGLAAEDGWGSDEPAAQQARDARHMARFFADELDPRAWNGVYKIVGEATGREVKELLMQPHFKN